MVVVGGIIHVTYGMADNMTALMICAVLWMAPLFGGKLVFWGKKKCPPTLLHAFGLLK